MRKKRRRHLRVPRGSPTPEFTENRMLLEREIMRQAEEPRVGKGLGTHVRLQAEQRLQPLYRAELRCRREFVSGRGRELYGLQRAAEAVDILGRRRLARLNNSNDTQICGCKVLPDGVRRLPW